MRTLWNILALLGLLILLTLGFGLYQYAPYARTWFALDQAAIPTLYNVGKSWLETGNAAEAASWKFGVAAGLSADDVEQVLLSVASEHNLKHVGEKPLSQQITAESGQKFRFLKIYEFCNAGTASRMADFSDAYTAFMPCRISLVEDKNGKLWLYTLNMDLLIHGGKNLPEPLKKEALQVRDTLFDILRRSATGEF